MTFDLPGSVVALIRTPPTTPLPTRIRYGTIPTPFTSNNCIVSVKIPAKDLEQICF